MSNSEKDEDDNIFSEMELYMVDCPEFDDSREAIYTKLENEGVIEELEKRIAAADKAPTAGESWESVYQRLSRKP